MPPAVFVARSTSRGRKDRMKNKQATDYEKIGSLVPGIFETLSESPVIINRLPSYPSRLSERVPSIFKVERVVFNAFGANRGDARPSNLFFFFFFFFP